jgi:arylsulfatase
MYVAYTAAHWPMHAKPADIAKYRGRYDIGYDAVRAARVEKLRRLGLLDSRWQVAAQDGGKWDDVKNREYETRCMEVYAAMVDCLDQGIGRIVAELKKQGELDNTLIFFLQDNGGCAEDMGRKDGAKAEVEPKLLPPLAADYLQPDMIPKQTRDGRPMRQGYGILRATPILLRPAAAGQREQYTVSRNTNIGARRASAPAHHALAAA